MKYELSSMIPGCAGMTAEQIALENSVYEPGTPEFEAYVAVVARNVTPEYLRIVGLWHRAVESRSRDLPKDKRGLTITPALVRESETHFFRAAVLAEDWNLTMEDVERAQARYGPWNLYMEDTAPWPTGKWFQFAQTRWQKSRWLMVPDLPAATLAMMGYKLHTSSRYMGDLTDDEIGELARLHYRSEVAGREAGKTDREGKGASTQHVEPISAEEDARIAELLSRCPFGGELPIFDIDSSGPRDADKLSPEQIAQANLELARRGAQIAKDVHAIWYDITSSHVRWTVSNTLGGLHGRHLRLPPAIRHPYLLLALEQEFLRVNEAKGSPVPILEKEVAIAERVVRVSLDTSTYHKMPGGRAGQWRSPYCRKDKPTSLPQVPVDKYVSVMPWLDPLTPSAIGSDWTYIGRDAAKRIKAICDQFQRKVDEADIKSGLAFSEITSSPPTPCSASSPCSPANS